MPVYKEESKKRNDFDFSAFDDAMDKQSSAAASNDFMNFKDHSKKEKPIIAHEIPVETQEVEPIVKESIPEAIKEEQSHYEYPVVPIVP